MLGAFMHLIALEAIKIQNTFTSFYMFNISFINCIKKDGPISCVHSVGLAASPPLFLSLWFCSKDVYIYIIFAYYTVYHYIPLCCNYRQNWQLPPVSVTCTCRWPYFSKKVAWQTPGTTTGRIWTRLADSVRFGHLASWLSKDLQSHWRFDLTYP